MGEFVRQSERDRPPATTAKGRSPDRDVSPARPGLEPTGAADVAGSSGRALDGGLRSEMEQRFGQRLPDVRLHMGAGAAHSALEQGARAYTVGRDIVFGTEEFAPHTSAGKRLLAHELAHVVQQTNANGSIGTSSAAEAEARTAADHAMAGRAPAIAHTATGIQREELSPEELQQRVNEANRIRKSLIPGNYGPLVAVEPDDPPARPSREIPPASLSGPSNIFPKRAAKPAAKPAPAKRAPKPAAPKPVKKPEPAPVQLQEVTIAADDPTLDVEAPAPERQPEQAAAPAPSPAPADPEKLIDQHTSWGNLNENALGKSLLDRAAAGDTKTTESVLDTLDASMFRSSDRDDVSLAFVSQATPEQLDALAKTDAGRKLLLRLYDELSSGHMSEEEAKQAQRVLQATTKTIDPRKLAEAHDRAPVIPYSGIGFTKFSSASLTVKRLPNGKIWVRSHMKREHWKDAKRLPDATFAAGMGREFDPNEIVGIHMYDEGGEVVYVPAMFLLQLSNTEDAKAKQMMIEAVVTGLTLGSGGGATAGGEAAAEQGVARGGTWGTRAWQATKTTAPKVLRVADATAMTISIESTLINDHRGLIIERFGDDGKEFLKDWAVVERVVGYYGMARGGVALGQTAVSLRASLKQMRAQRAQLKNLSAEESQALDQITRQTEQTIAEIEQANAAARGKPTKPMPEPVDPTDAAAWKKYYEQNPNAPRHIGAAQALPEVVTDIGAAEHVTSTIHPNGRVSVGFNGESVDIHPGAAAQASKDKLISELGMHPDEASKVLNELPATTTGRTTGWTVGADNASSGNRAGMTRSTDPAAFNEFDMGPPTGPTPSLYRGSKPADKIGGVRRTKPTRGEPSETVGGTEHRGGSDLHTYTPAELSPARLRTSWDEGAGRATRTEYQVHPSVADTSQVSEASFSKSPLDHGAQSRDSAYTHSGFERGHLAQREAFAGVQDVERAADHWTNVTPMSPRLNKAPSPWRAAESRAVREAKLRGEPIVVRVTPRWGKNPTARLSDGTPIAEGFWREHFTQSGVRLECTYYPNL